MCIFFIYFSLREEEDEEEQEELGGFRLLTDDNVFESEEVCTDGARQAAAAFCLREFHLSP